MLTYVLALALSAAGLPDAVVEAGLGVNIHFTSPRDGELQQLAAAGVKWVRMDFAWEATERVAGQYDFGAYDKLLAACDQQGLRALLILDYKNKLYDQGLSPHSPSGRAAFAKWAAAAAVHFKGRGVLWEMYNEPNIGFWKPKPNVDDYIALALETGRALRAAAPDELYCGPATSTIDLPFLESCCRAGLLDYWCAVTVHPYRQSAPETVVDEYRRLRVVLARYAPAGKRIPILSGEWGYSSVWKGFDAERQGRYLPRQWLVNVSQDVPLSIWYDWHDDGTRADEPEHHFGTVDFAYRRGQDPVYEPKPAYLAARTLTAQLKGFRLNKRLVLPDPRDWLLLFERGHELKLAAWTTSPTPHELRLPFGGQFTVTGHLGQEQPPLQAGAPLTLNESVQYLTPAAPDDALRAVAAWSRAPLDYLAGADTRELALSTAWTNPFDRSRNVQLVLHGLATSGPSDVAPRGRLTLPGRLPVTRDELSRLVRSELRLDPQTAFVQESLVCQTAPLVLTCLSASRAGLPVRLANPSGAAFRGSLQLTGVKGLELASDAQPLDLAPGQREQTLTFALRPGTEPGAEYQLSARVLDAAGVAVVRAPNLRFVPVQGFPLAAGQAPPYQWLPDGDAKVKSTQTLEVATPPLPAPVPGAAVLKLTYSCEAGWKFFRLAPRPALAAQWAGQPKALGVWVCGDGHGLSARLRFRDSAGQTFQPSAADLTTQDWRYLTFRLDGEGTWHWGGANDGVPRGPLSLDTLFLLDNTARTAISGELYLQAPVLIY